MTYCTRCGKELPEGAKFCPNCGGSRSHVVGLRKTAAETIERDSYLQQHWVKRIIAIVIDSIIVGIATFIVGGLTNLVGIFNWLIFPFAMGVVYLLYFSLMESSYGYTVGKRLVTLKVVTVDGRKPNLEGAVIRNISKIHWIFLLLDAIGGFYIATDPHQKYLDQLAQTTVI
jgi:uncharacterized RDD family membrane protein YckC